MSVEAGLRAHLVADATVNDIVSGRIYNLLPQGVTYPAIRFQRISVSRFVTLDGPNDLTGVRMQVDCFDSDYAIAKDLATKVRQSLNGVTDLLGAVTIDNVTLEGGDTDLTSQDGDSITRQVSLDFVVQLNEV